MQDEPVAVPIRHDPLTGDQVIVVAARQARPNLPATGCPFCPGGLEAPEPYDVRWFPNRWPSMPGDRCEVVLYTDDHDATFASLGVAGARKVVDLWAERTAALGARADVAGVLCFENRGPEVGATIAHPHGQIYAYETVPPRLAAEIAADGFATALGDGPRGASDDRLVCATGSARAFVPWAASWPYELVVAPTERRPDLVALPPDERDDLAAVLVDALSRLDALFDAAMPYMLWIHQQPTDGSAPAFWLHVHIAPLWRGPGTPRFVAAAEVGAQVYVNPVEPVDAAAALRTAGGPTPQGSGRP